MSMIDLRYIKKLIEMLDGSTVDSVEISSDKGMKLRISKSPQGKAAVQLPTPAQVPAVMAAPLPPPAPAPAAAAAPPPAAAESAPRAPAAASGVEVKSPMVGTFYGSPEPGAKPYVEPGSRVSKGQVLCIIEAMKIMNEIESEHAGVVREVRATDAHPVEYGQVLFLIDPNG